MDGLRLLDRETLCLFSFGETLFFHNFGVNPSLSILKYVSETAPSFLPF